MVHVVCLQEQCLHESHQRSMESAVKCVEACVQTGFGVSRTLFLLLAWLATHQHCCRVGARCGVQLMPKNTYYADLRACESMPVVCCFCFCNEE